MFSDAERAALIAHLFRRQMGKEPSAQELPHYLDAARDLDDQAFAAALIDQALFSPESATLMRDRMMAAQAAPLRALERVQIASLGTNCLASDLLARMGLRQASGPLDWLLFSPEMVEHALRDDFATLLDPAHFRPILAADRAAAGAQCEHAFYEARPGANRGVFVHRDPTKPEDLDYLRRCAARFKALAHSDARTLFVLLHMHMDEPRDYADVYERIRALIGEKYRGACVFIDVLPNTATMLARIDKRGDDHWRFQMRAGFQSIQPEDPLDALMLTGALARLMMERLRGR